LWMDIFRICKKPVWVGMLAAFPFFNIGVIYYLAFFVSGGDDYKQNFGFDDNDPIKKRIVKDSQLR